MGAFGRGDSPGARLYVPAYSFCFRCHVCFRPCSRIQQVCIAPKRRVYGLLGRGLLRRVFAGQPAPPGRLPAHCEARRFGQGQGRAIAALRAAGALPIR